MAQIRLTTTGTQNPVVINDLGAVSFAHPTTNFVLYDSDGSSTFTLEEVRDSADLQTALTAGYITIDDELGNPITDVVDAVNAAGGDNLGDHTATEDLKMASNKIVDAEKLNSEDGTQALPTYSFDNDPDTGMYREGSGDLAFANDGLCTLEIASNGHIFVSPADVPNYEALVTTDNSIPNKKYVDDAITGASGIAGDQAALVVERTTDLAVTGTPTDVSFNVTGTENEPSELEHNNTTPTRLDIKTNGLHQIAFSLNCINSAVADKMLVLELKINGSTVKTINFEIGKSSEELVTRITAVELTAGTYVTFAASQSGGGTDLTLKATTVAYILKCQGQKGDTGATGAGSTVLVQDEGTPVSNPVDTFDFVGAGVSVAEVGNKATVTVASAAAPTFKEALNTITNGSSGAWITKTLVGFENQVVQIMMENNSAGTREMGVRAVGSVIQRKLSVVKATHAVNMLVQANATGQIQIFEDASGGVIYRNFGGII